MGFDVLAFESGFYDCHRAWQAFEAGEDGVAAARLGVFGIWTGSKQTAPLWSYLQEQVATSRPLELVGFDCQYTASASTKHLNRDLQNLIDDSAFPISEESKNKFLAHVRELAKGSIPDGDNQSFVETATDLQQHLIGANEGKLEPERSRFWQQQLKSMIAHARYRWRDNDEDEWSNTMARDLQMADNLNWLATQAYKDRKIIVWAASFHIVRNIQQIKVPDGSIDYSNMTQMGHAAHKMLQSQLFTIGFTAYEGKAGTYFRSAWNIPEAPEGTFEDICFRAGLQNALIPMTAEWMQEPQFSRPLGYAWMESRWHKNFDAMIFNRKMTPSTRANR